MAGKKKAPPKQAAAKAPPAAQEVGLEQQLTQLQDWARKGLITEAEAAAQRRVLLKLPEATVPAKADIASLETDEQRKKRELTHLVASWSGSALAPLVGGELWEALHNGTPDEVLRVALQQAQGSPLQSKIWATFVAAGKGGVPAAFTGDTPAEEIARLAARQWQRQVCAALAASRAAQARQLGPEERRRIQLTCFALFDDSALHQQAGVILGAVAKDERAKAGAVATARFKGTCNNCGDPGHFARDCARRGKGDKGRGERPDNKRSDRRDDPRDNRRDDHRDDRRDERKNPVKRERD
jgi:hypothetical protein